MATGFTVTGDTGARLPDLLPELTKGGLPTNDVLAEWWGPGRKSALNPYDAKTQDLDTIVERYQGIKTQQYSQIVVFPIMTGGGYATEICPLERSTGITSEWHRVNYQGGIMDPAPELSAPNYVTHTSEKHTSSMQRFSKAARISGDYYKTPEGQRQMEDMTIQLTFTAWTLVISMFELNVVKAKQYWQDWMLEYGVKCSSFQDAVSDEIEQFGMFNKDDKAIYKLWAFVKKTMTTYTPTLAVFKQGVTDFLALSGDFETNAQLNGLAESKTRLMQAGNALKGTFNKVLDIYETARLDHQFNDNIDQLSNWERLVCFGRCAIMCGQEQRGCYNGSNSVCKLEGLYDLEHISMDIDSWKVLKIKEVWKKSMRFDDKGTRTHPYLDDFIAHIHDIAQNAGVQIINNGVDPYVWYSPSDFTDEGEYPNNNGYHVIKYWGDMEPRYYTLEQNIEHGEIAANIIQNSKELSSDDFKKIISLECLRKELANPPELDESVVGSVVLVEMMNKNSRGSNSSIVKRGGTTGAPQLPYRVEDKLIKGLYYLSDTESGPNQRALWVIYQDKAKEIFWQRGDAEVVGAEENKFATSNLVSPVPNDENSVSLKLPKSLTKHISDEEVPIAYILAPLNAFGKIEDEYQREATFNLNGDTPIDAEYIAYLSQDVEHKPNYIHPLLPTKTKIEKAIKATVGEGAPNTTYDAFKNLTNLQVDGKSVEPEMLIGGQRARLVRAPSMPYGWAGISHIHELANRHKSGGRGWKEASKIAYEGLESRKKYDQKLRKLYPDNALINAAYCPEFMKTNITRINEDYSLDVNVIHGPENPIFVRVSLNEEYGIFGENGVGIYTPAILPTEVIVAPRTNNKGLINVDPNEIVKALKFIGLVNADSKDYKYSGKYVDQFGSFAALFYHLLNNEQIPVSFRESLLNPDQRAASWQKTYGRIAESYLSLLESEGKASSSWSAGGSEILKSSIGFFFLQEIYAPILRTANSKDQFDKGAGMFGEFLKMLERSENLSNMNPIKRSYLDSLANSFESKKRIRKESKKYTEYTTARRGQQRATITDTQEQWVNSTLVFDNSIFAAMAKAAIIGSRSENITKISLLPISPADPENPHMPLFKGPGRDASHEGIPSESLQGGKVVSEVNAKEYIKSLQYAKGRFSATNLDDCAQGKSTLSSSQLPSYLQPYRPQDLKVVIDNFEDNIHERLTFDATESEFVTPEEVINDRGESIQGKSRMVKRIHLAKRWKRLGKMTNEFARHCAQLLCFTRVTRQSLENWLDNGVPTPDDSYIFAQPFNTIVASFGLFAIKGAGRTNFNYEDAALYFDGNHKMWEIHFTAWFGIAFPLPEGLLIVKDIMWHGLKSGMTDDVYSDPNEFDPERINFGSGKCGFFFTCGSAFSRTAALKTSHPLPLYGRWISSSIPTNVVNRNALLENRAPLWPSFLYYTYVWRFHLMISKYGILDTTSYLAEKSQTTINGNMYHMITRARNPNTGRFEIDCEGYGHLGTLEPPLRARFAGKITTRTDKKL